LVPPHFREIYQFPFSAIPRQIQGSKAITPSHRETYKFPNRADGFFTADHLELHLYADDI